MLSLMRQVVGPGPGPGFRWFIAAAAFAFMMYGYYEHWRDDKRAEALLVWLLGAALFLWSGLHWGFALLAVIVIGWLSLWFVRPRLPRLAISRAHQAFTLTWAPAERAGKRRLRREALALAQEMYDYIQNHPDDWLEKLTHHFNPTEEDANEKWARLMEERRKRDDEQGLAIQREFGGRLAHLLGEFNRRGLIADDDARLLTWKLGSLFWMREAARDIDALARKL